MSVPHLSAYVMVPGDCPVTCEFTGDHDIEIRLGSTRETFDLVFERDALARLVEIGTRALAVSLPEDPRAALPTLRSGPVPR